MPPAPAGIWSRAGSRL
jgi:hypothetical protein